MIPIYLNTYLHYITNYLQKKHWILFILKILNKRWTTLT